ncbi:MAG: metallophosphoesterase [Pseudomonadota bacterium]
MPKYRLVQLSDPHLSGTHPLFHHNWEVALTAVEELAPDAVIVTGDLSYNGPSSVADLDYAQRQMDRISAPFVRVLPGNHDVGHTPAHPHASQVLTETTLAQWCDRFGADYWVFDQAGWRFIGLNPFLAGSGLPEEHAQEAMLEDALATADGPVGVFVHIPLFLQTPDEALVAGFNMQEPERGRWLGMLAGRVHFVASGHLHKHLAFDHGGIAYHWCPALSFVQTNGDSFAPGTRTLTGFLLHEFDGLEHKVEVIEPQDIINMDIRNWSEGPEHSYMRIAKRPFPMP